MHVLLFTIHPTIAATGKGSSQLAFNSGPVLQMMKTGGENVQFGTGVEAFYYAFMQPSELHVGNAVNLIFSASHYQNASLTIRTTGLNVLPQSIVVRQFHDREPALATKFTYDQRMLAETAPSYLFDLSQTHDVEASDASLYFAFAGGDASLELELTSEGKTLLKKRFDFLVGNGIGTAELILKSNPNATALQKDGIVLFGIGLEDTKDSGSVQASMEELSKQNWNWSSDIRTTGGITLAEQGGLPVLKDNVAVLNRGQWFIRSIRVADTENKTGTVEMTWGDPVPAISAYATADGAIAVSYLRLYHEWKYDLVNRPPGSGVPGTASTSDTSAGGQDTTDSQSSAITDAAGGGAATDSSGAPQASETTMAPIAKIGLISVGGVAASGGFFFLFLFFFNAVRYMVKISGVVFAAGTALSGGEKRVETTRAAGPHGNEADLERVKIASVPVPDMTGGEDSLKIEQVRLLKKLRTAVRSNQTTSIDLTGVFDFTAYTCVKINWNPKAFRGKRNITIRYLFDGKTLHEDVFRNSKQAVSERIIEMVPLPLQTPQV